MGAFVFREEIFEFVRIAGDRAFDIVIFTNQPEVARGNFELTDMQKIEEYCRTKLPLLDYFACYHDDSDACGCRKPKPGMLIQAIKKWEIDPSRSFVVGDRDKDIIAGRAAGIRSILLENSVYDKNSTSADGYITDLLNFSFE